MVDVNNVVGVVAQHGKLLGGAYHIRADDAALLLEMWRGGDHSPLMQAAADLGADISIVYGTCVTSELDIPAFLRRQRYEKDGTPFFMTEEEMQLRFNHPEKYSTRAIVITKSGISER